MSIAAKIHDDLYSGTAGYVLDGETIDRARIIRDIVSNMNPEAFAEWIMSDFEAWRLTFLTTFDLACSEMADRIAADRAAKVAA